MDEVNNVIILTDEAGNEVPFECLDLVEHEGSTYAVLLPAEPMDEESAGEVVILRVEDDPDDPDSETYAAVLDEALLDTIFDIFKERMKGILDFEED